MARIICAALVGAVLFGAASWARAETASCEIPVIQALPGNAHAATPSIDPQISRLSAYLSKPPFTAWHEFKLLQRHELQVAEGRSQQFELPNGRVAELTFLGHLSKPAGHRMRLGLVIEDKDKKKKLLDTTFLLEEGGVILQVGQKCNKGGGIMIVGVSCKTSN